MATDRPVASAATVTYIYGVAHVQDGELNHEQRHLSRDLAENDLRGCRSADLNECYLIRMPVGGWEKVPDGE